jgi:hypothetical protein
MNASPARRLIAPQDLREGSHEALAAIKRNSPEAAYWYARTAASAARLLADAEADRLAAIVSPAPRVQGCACAGCEAGGLCLAGSRGLGVFWAEPNRGNWRNR